MMPLVANILVLLIWSIYCIVDGQLLGKVFVIACLQNSDIESHLSRRNGFSNVLLKWKQDPAIAWYSTSNYLMVHKLASAMANHIYIDGMVAWQARSRLRDHYKSYDYCLQIPKAYLRWNNNKFIPKYRCDTNMVCWLVPAFGVTHFRL